MNPGGGTGGGGGGGGVGRGGRRGWSDGIGTDCHPPEVSGAGGGSDGALLCTTPRCDMRIVWNPAALCDPTIKFGR